MTGTPERRRYRPDIEGLRGVAILLVVAYHAGLPLDGGYIGVDVFFVLSGYLITGILVNEFDTTGGVNLWEFYARRARRLLPAAAFVLVTTLVAAAVLLSPFEQRTIARSGGAVALYVGNFDFARQATDYLAAEGTHANPLLHTWSLAVEEQFYFVWPLFVLTAALVGRRVRRPRAALAVSMAAMILVSLGLALWLTEVLQPWAFFGSPARFWEFAVGGLAALLPANALRGRVGMALAVAGGSLVVGAALTFDDTTAFPGSAALMPVLGTAIILTAGAAGNRVGVFRALDHRSLSWIGRHSYSWYLWHWPVLVFARAIWPSLSVAGAIAAALFSLLLSVITLRVIENPIRYSGLLVPRARTSVAAGVTLALVGVTVAFGLHRDASASISSDPHARFAAAQADRPGLDGCNVGYLAVEPEESCVYGDTNGDRTMFLFGDSHAGQWFPAAAQVASDAGYRLEVFVKSECPSVSVDIFTTKLGRWYTECNAWRRRVLARVADVRPDLVIITNSAAYVPAPLRDSQSRVSSDQWRSGTQTTLEAIVAAGARPVVILDTPRPGFHVPFCLSRAASRVLDRECSFSRDEAINESVQHAERAAISHAGAAAVDLTDAICPGESCPVEKGSTVIYRDTNHLTATFSEQLANVLGSALGALWPCDDHGTAADSCEGES